MLSAGGSPHSGVAPPALCSGVGVGVPLLREPNFSELQEQFVLSGVNARRWFYQSSFASVFEVA